MSRQALGLVCVGNLPKYTGFTGSEISIKQVPLSTPIMAYSFPSAGSVQPQESFPAEAPKVARLI